MKFIAKNFVFVADFLKILRPFLFTFFVVGVDFGLDGGFRLR